MAENTEKVRGNPILPKPPIPSQVRMSMVPKPPEPIPRVMNWKLVGTEVVPPSTFSDSEIEKKSGEEVDAQPKGTIVIKVFENSPYEVEFSGMITGSEIDIAWKAMMKEYRVWKHNLSKKTVDNGGV